MTNNATLVINAFLKLLDSEKQDVIVEIENYKAKDFIQKSRMTDEFQERIKRIMGPVSSGGCAICGK